MNLNDIEKLDDAPKSQKMREGMERRYKGVYTNYPWNKVERFLFCRLGQPQDKVSSEFLKLNWLPKEHRTIKQFDYHVKTNTFINNGEICVYDEHPRDARGYWQINEHYSDVFYIHPTTKLLCFYKQKKINWTKIYREREAKTLRILGDYHQLLKLDGIWYEVKGKKKRIIDYYLKLHAPKIFSPNDRLIPENGIPYRSHLADIDIIYKKELNSKELKKFGLTNDGPKMSGKKCPKCGGYNCRIHLTEG